MANTGTEPGQSTLSSFVVASAGSRYEPSSLRQKSLTASLVRHLIVDCGLPISLVDHPSFRAFLRDFDAKYVPPCRQTVTDSILPYMLNSTQNKITQVLDKSSDVSLTADIWTDRRMHSFLGVTVHMFHDGKPYSYLLAFRVFSGSHTGQKIADTLESIISQNSLQGKIRCIVTDNASNMRKAMSVMFEVGDSSFGFPAEVDDPSLWEDDIESDVLGTVGMGCEHISCFAHSLQLVVHDGLDALTMTRLLLAKTSKLSNLIHQSSLFRGMYEEGMGSGKIVPSANETRWNSVFCQLKVVAGLDQTRLNSVLHDSNHDNLKLTPRDLAQLNEIVKLLEPFAEATLITPGEKMVTISCVVPIVLALQKHLHSSLATNSSLKPVITTLLQSLEGRFCMLFALLDVPSTKASGFNGLQFTSNLFVMAPALDPEYAFNWLQDHPGNSEAKDALRFKITGMMMRVLFIVELIY